MVENTANISHLQHQEELIYIICRINVKNASGG